MRNTMEMRKTVFPPGKMRQVCVIRPAIDHNMRYHTNYPTCLVLDGDSQVEFHCVKTKGQLTFDRTQQAKVFIETDDEIEGFIDPSTPDQSFLAIHFPKLALARSLSGLLLRFKRKVFWLWKRTPIIGCITQFSEDE